MKLLLLKDQAIDGLSDELKAAQDTVASIKEEIAARDEELTEAKTKIEAFEAEVKTMARKSALVEAGLEGEDIETALEKFSDAADEIFDEVVSLYSKMKKTIPSRRTTRKTKTRMPTLLQRLQKSQTILILQMTQKQKPMQRFWKQLKKLKKSL